MTPRRTTTRTLSPAETPSEGLAAVQSWPSTGARTWTIDALRQAKGNAAITAIVATGSAVRDVEQSDDLDLVLVYREGRPALPRPPIDVDLRQYEQAQVDRKLAAGHGYLAAAVRYGRALYERDGWWSRLRADWNERLALPSAAGARARAARDGAPLRRDAGAGRSRRRGRTQPRDADAPRARRAQRRRSLPAVASRVGRSNCAASTRRRWPTGWPMRWRTGTGSAPRSALDAGPSLCRRIAAGL